MCFITPVDFVQLFQTHMFLNLTMTNEEISAKPRKISINTSKSEKMSLRHLTVQMFKMRVKEFNNVLSKSGDTNDLEAVIQFNKLVSIGKRIMQILLGNQVIPFGLQGWPDFLSNLQGI